MIRTMQLVALLARASVSAPIFEKMPNPVINHISVELIAGITSGCRSPVFARSASNQTEPVTQYDCRRCGVGRVLGFTDRCDLLDAACWRGASGTLGG
jgi:hypothetical protein